MLLWTVKQPEQGLPPCSGPPWSAGMVRRRASVSGHGCGPRAVQAAEGEDVEGVVGGAVVAARLRR